MGIKHANRIQEGLRRARATDDALAGFMDGTVSAQAAKEKFFVKNLERVQGDERDAIILTIGYGKTSTGGCSTALGRSTTKAANGAST
jgi:hypothetical protein